MREIEIVVYGIPQPQGSKTPFAVLVPVNGPFNGKIYTLINGVRMRIKTWVAEGRRTEARKAFDKWRKDVTIEAKRAMTTQSLAVALDGPLWLSATFFVPRPPSLPKRVKYPISRPDLNKYSRAISDSLQDAGMITNDARIIDEDVHKRFATMQPCVVIRLREVV